MSRVTKVIIGAALVLAVEVAVMAVFISWWIVPIGAGCVVMILASSVVRT